MMASTVGMTESKSYEIVAGQLSTPTGSNVGGATRTTSAPSIERSNTFERATRECKTSPTIAMRRPFRSLAPLPRCLRIVKASRRAWLGCSCVPSPALITLPDIHSRSAKRWAAPDAEWRITTASAPMACKVCAVSLRDSPLLALEPLALKLITSAERRLAAASKEIRVRVESSAKRLTIVRPRSVGSFFTCPSLMRANSVAVSRIPIASAALRSLIERRCRISLPLPL